MGQVESMLDSFDEVDRKEVLDYDLTIHGVCNKIKSYDIHKIVVLAGAGLSTAAGIPDFRTPGTGLYSNLQKYNLPKPECMFDIDYFNENPEPFYTFANELLPGKYYPTLGHYFLCLLEKKGILQRVYTQNIDMLERIAGLNPEKLVECHGNFASSHCVKCHEKYDSKIVEDAIKDKKIAYCTNDKCENGILKPSIIFFGETLPERFKWLTSTDMMSADLLIIIGTSLNVEPCASLVYQVGDLCPRLLINLEPVGPFKDYKNPRNYRDVYVKDSINNAVLTFCKEMGWEKDLYRIQQKKTRQLDYEYHPERIPSAFQSFVNALKTLSPFSPRTDDDDDYDNNNNEYDKSSNNNISSSCSNNGLPYYNNITKTVTPSSPLKNSNDNDNDSENDNNNNVRTNSITSVSSSVISSTPSDINSNTNTATVTTNTTSTSTSMNKVPLYIQSVE